MQIKFVTRSGGNDFTGSGYHYYRSDKLNANTWFNNRNDVAKAQLKQNQAGVRAGGPIVIPGLFDGRNKAFFFVNYEEFRQPGATTRDRNILNTAAQQGIFTYIPTGGSRRQVNLLALAAANGQTSTTDPTISAILRDIRTAVDGRLDSTSGRQPRALLVQRGDGVDQALSDDAHRLQHHRQAPLQQRVQLPVLHGFPDTLNNLDASFPGFPVEAGQTSERYSISNSLRSTLSTNLVNEVLVA